MADQTLLLSYLFLIFFQTVHILEEISHGIFDLQVGPIKMTQRKYLLVSSALSAITVTPMALLLYDISFGYYLGLFTSGVIGILQGVVHTVGFIKAGTVRGSFGAGFYTSIPLSITGVIVFIQLLQNLP